MPEYAWRSLGPTPRFALLKNACLVREIRPNHYAFIDTLLFEYFLARNLYDQLTTYLVANNSAIESVHISTDIERRQQNKSAIAAISNDTPTQIQYSALTKEEDYFNERLFIKEEYTLQFLAEKVDEQTRFKKILLKKIYKFLYPV